MVQQLLQWLSQRQDDPHRLAHRSRRPTKRSPILLFVLLLLWSLILGWGLAQAQEVSQTHSPLNQPTEIGTIDPIPEQYQLGHRLYLEHCSSCHVALPPAAMPNETWRQLLSSSDHYGAELVLPNDIERRLIWNYMLVFSRPLLEGEPVPYRLPQSRYFKALHPGVEFLEPVNARTCVTCHPGAEQFDFRRLSAAWQE